MNVDEVEGIVKRTRVEEAAAKFQTPDKSFNHVDISYRPVITLPEKDAPFYINESTRRAYDRVSKILDPLSWAGLTAWRQRETIKRDGDVDAALKFCDEWGGMSMRVGTAMHKIIEDYLNNKPVSDGGGAGLDFNPFHLFSSVKHNLNRIDNIRGVEIRVHSDNLNLAGTIDCVADFDGRPAIIDHKNSRREKTPSEVRKYMVQEAIYGIMWEELTGEVVELLVTNMATWVMKPRAFVVEFKDWREEAVREIASCRRRLAEKEKEDAEDKEFDFD